MTRLTQLLFGRGAFAPVHHILEDLPLERVGERPSGLPHSIFEELWHLDYWQRYLLAAARGDNPGRPEHAALSWPERPGPQGEKAWADLLESLRLGLDEAAGLAADDQALERTVGERGSVRGLIESLAVHNAYHLGRVVAARQILGMWPPSSGGDTW